jgi:OmpA-OmpF porin, OOP family
MTTAFANATASGRIVLATLALACAAPVFAQPVSGTGMLLPGSSRSAIGLNIGASHGHLSCSTQGACDDTDRHLHLFGRSMFSGHWGAQVSLFDLGDVTRGADSRARGLNLSLVGRVPLGAKFSGWGRIGTTYGQAAGSPVAVGLAGSPESGFGLSYGLGVSWDFSPRLSAVVEWDSHDLRFPGSGRDPVRATSLGLHYRY